MLRPNAYLRKRDTRWVRMPFGERDGRAVWVVCECGASVAGMARASGGVIAFVGVSRSASFLFASDAARWMLRLLPVPRGHDAACPLLWFGRAFIGRLNAVGPWVRGLHFGYMNRCSLLRCVALQVTRGIGGARECVARATRRVGKASLPHRVQERVIAVRTKWLFFFA